MIVTDKAKIEEFLTRGIENIYPSKDFLKKRLNEGKPLTMYLGIDATGPTLHLGHAIVLKKIGEFQKLGHKAILLIGDFTSIIGDPTGKDSTRPVMTREKILKNSAKYQEQAKNFLDFGGDNPAELKYNSEWLSKLNFEEVLNLASHMTVDQMLKRDMFEERARAGKPIFMHEFFYPLMQGYDAVAMDVDGEIGGNDQIFNMLVGRDLMKNISNKDKFVVGVKLLTDPTGRKMGKTENNMVKLDDKPEEMFGKIMSWTDGMIIPGFQLSTNLSLEEIEEIKKELEGGANPKDKKMELAGRIVEIYHGERKAKEARENFDKTFSKKEIPENPEEIKAFQGEALSDTLLKAGVISSKAEFKRLVDQGGITDLDKGEKIDDYKSAVIEEVTFRVGKKRFVKIKF